VVELRFAGEAPPVGGVFDGAVARIEELPDRVLLYTDDGDALVPVAHERLNPQSVLVRRSTLALQEYEKRLGLLAEAARRRRALEAMERELNGLKRRIAKLEGAV